MNASTGPVRKWSVRLLDWLIWRPISWCTRQGYRFTRWVLRPQSWLRFFSWIRFSSISLRRWLFIALLVLMLLPGLVAGMVAIGITLFEPYREPSTVEMVRSDTQLWLDPVWQQELDAKAARDQAQVVVYEGDKVVFKTDDAHIPPAPEYGDDLIIIAPEDTDYTADITTNGTLHGDRYWPVPVSYFIALALTFVGIALFFGRSVVKPLAATSDAASDVAGGNLDIALPSSRVREVRELNAAFEGMAVELKESLEHEAKLQQERKQFISAIVHDLRTPLFALRGSFEAIETGVADTPEKQKYYFELARERADALDRMITDLFEFTRLEYLAQAPEHAPVEFGPLVERVAGTLQSRADEQGSTILLDIRSDLCEISADAHMLTRAIDNLIDNAIRYSGPNSTIWIEVLSTSDSVILSVSDSGPGIPADDLPNVFTPLFRGESSRNRKTGGAGLGLTISRNIFIAHGGTLTARNRTPHGAMFIGSLPCSHREIGS